MTVNPVYNLKSWFEENKEKLKPPVGNKLVYEDDDWIVMAVGGPNSRKDFHYHTRSPEFFYMVKGDMILRIMEEEGEKPEDIRINEGEIFLMPKYTIHSPQRPVGSWGLVLEGKTKPGDKDYLRWYCENCNNKLTEYEFDLNNIVTELPPLMKKFFGTDELRTCSECEAYMEDPEPFELPD